MKKQILITSVAILMTIALFAQKSIPEMKIKDLYGTPVSTSEFTKGDQPVLLVFWATWCTHTIDGLGSISDDYLDDWSEEYDLKVVAVSVDDMRTFAKVKPMAISQGWEFDIYTDVNADFKRSMNVNNAPFMMLFNSDGKMAWQQNAFNPGDEEVIEAELEKL